MYIYEQPKWPEFYWDELHVATLLTQVRFEQGRLLGRMDSLGGDIQINATCNSLSEDVLQSNEIEGEFLDAAAVRSSVAKRIGFTLEKPIPIDPYIDSIVNMMLDATQNFTKALTQERLFDWHCSLFPENKSDLIIGHWRDDSYGPMQVVSGKLGRETVHFQAPNAQHLPFEMHRFIEWFNTKSKIDDLLKAAIAQLWFVTLHPFDDGNGRIARVLSDLMLARSENSTKRFYSMSAQIRLERASYYTILERTQKGDLDITKWIDWFLNCLLQALLRVDTTLTSIIQQRSFWQTNASILFNERQKKILNLLLSDFKGTLTSSKWAKIAKCSQDTAYRDLYDLIKKGVLKQNPGKGKNTNYGLH